MFDIPVVREICYGVLWWRREEELYTKGNDENILRKACATCQIACS